MQTMHDSDNRQAREEVQHLHRLALDAETEGQFATMERLLEQAVAVAQRLDDLPLLIQERFWLAYAQDMQSKDMQAIATYSWLISLANDPSAAHLLTSPSTLGDLMESFIRFVGCGRFMPEMSAEQLLRVVADGMNWLERIGKANWAAGLKLEKGLLLWHQENMESARLELEAALALKRRNPESFGYNLGYHLVTLADVLLEKPFNAYGEARALTEEALSVSTSAQYNRASAYRIIATAHMKLGEYKEALHAAQQSLLLAQTMESSHWVRQAYEILGEIHRETGHLAEAAQAAAHQWRWARRDNTIAYHYNALRDCARVRNLQARVASGLPAALAPLPTQIPAEALVTLASRRLQSTRRFVHRATPLATRLDRASGRRTHQEELDKLLQSANALEAWLLEQRPL